MKGRKRAGLKLSDLPRREGDLQWYTRGGIGPKLWIAHSQRQAPREYQVDKLSSTLSRLVVWMPGQRQSGSAPTLDAAKALAAELEAVPKAQVHEYLDKRRRGPMKTAKSNVTKGRGWRDFGGGKYTKIYGDELVGVVGFAEQTSHGWRGALYQGMDANLRPVRVSKQVTTKNALALEGKLDDMAERYVAKIHARIKRESKSIRARERDTGLRGAKGNRGKPPGKKKWIGKAIKHPGKLGGKGFMGKSVAEQRAILDRCVRMKQYGYRSCLGSVQLLENISTSSAHKERLGGLRRYLVAKYSPNRARYRRNPDDGSWEAVPAIVVPFAVRGVKLTRAQIEEITVYT